MKQFDHNLTLGDVAKVPSIDLSLIKLEIRRKLWPKVHLWLGLILELLLDIYHITGSILVFHNEIDELLNSKLLTVAMQNNKLVRYKPLSEIFQAGQEAMPKQAEHSYSDYPRNDNAAFKPAYPCHHLV